MLLNKILLIYLVIHLLISITCFLVFCDSFTSKRYNGFINNNLATLALLSLLAPVILMFLGLMAIGEGLSIVASKCLDGFADLINKITGVPKEESQRKE